VNDLRAGATIESVVLLVPFFLYFYYSIVMWPSLAGFGRPDLMRKLLYLLGWLTDLMLILTSTFYWWVPW